MADRVRLARGHTTSPLSDARSGAQGPATLAATSAPAALGPAFPQSVASPSVSAHPIDRAPPPVRVNLPRTLPPRGVELVQPELGPAPLPSRYEELGAIGSGGFGVVLRVWDRILERVLAMKVLHAQLVRSEHVRSRFLTEARITAGLQHPGIIAVHDLGELADGRLWFTMREVRGRTLRAVIDEVHEAAEPDRFVETRLGWSFRRLLDAFARISQAVAFAHRSGVMHRDLKPDNLMVGELGDVLVMDWGLARRVDAGEDEGTFDSMDLPADITRLGDVLGTPAYMPPEQAHGHRHLHGTASDVYALGAILYHVLSGRPPYAGTGPEVLRQVEAGPPAPLTDALLSRPKVPEELVALCERSMRREIGERYADAEPFAREIVAFLDGARRREQALAELETARAMEPEIAGLRGKAAHRREEAQALLFEAKPYDPIEKKQRGWSLEDEAAALDRDAALFETTWLQKVHAALILDPELPEAHAVLADHYRERLSTAELAHADEDVARFEALLRTHDRGQHAAFLRGHGALSLVTDPPGAVAYLERYELRDRRLVPADAGVLGETPLRDVPLQHGSYRLRLRAPGRAEVFYPVQIERGQRWDDGAPGQSEPFPIALPEEGQLGPDDCYVPAGWCWVGGDPLAGDSLPLWRVWVDAFVIRRFPVTNHEYLAFLDDLVARGREAEALAACPKAQPGEVPGDHPAFGRDASGRFLLRVGASGIAERLDWPVVQVDWHGAMAYARWLAQRTDLALAPPQRAGAGEGGAGRRRPPLPLGQLPRRHLRLRRREPAGRSPPVRA